MVKPAQNQKLTFGAPQAKKSPIKSLVTPNQARTEDIEMDSLTLEDKNKSNKSPVKTSITQLGLNNDDSDDEINLVRKPRRSLRRNNEEESDEGGLDVPVSTLV